MDALTSLEQAVADAQDAPARIRALNTLSTELARTGQAKRALAIAQEAETVAGTAGDARLRAETQHTIGRCHFYLADFVPALELLLGAARMYQDSGDLPGAATALAGVGLCQHRLGAQEDAIASMLRALQSAEEMGYTTLEINLHNSLASALLAANRTDDAARHIATGIDLARAARNDSLLTKLLMNESQLAMKRGDACAGNDPDAANREYEDGLVKVDQALALARGLGNPYDEAHCLGERGTLLRHLRRDDTAAESLDAALALGRALDESHVQAEALLELGRLRMVQDDRPAARDLLEQAIGLAGRINAKGLLADACESLSGLLERTGEPAAALALYKRFHAVREQELATSRKHAAHANQLWLDFQRAARQVTRYREEAALLAEDRNALAKRAEVLAEESQQDPLTGLLNRRGLDLQLGTLLTASELSGANVTVALMDIDSFKAINDSFSHPIGDVVLKRVAMIIRAHCRANDLPVRYGGDEFLLVLAGADLEAGERVVRRLKRTIDAEHWPAVAPGLRVTLSIGLAQRAQTQTIAATIAAADHALYAAKTGGRDRIVLAASS